MVTIDEEASHGGGAMFKVERVRDDRLDIQMSGKLDSAGMSQALDELVEKSEGLEAGKMLFDVIDYHLPSFGALTIEFYRMPKLFGWIRKFHRAAVLSDETWLKRISEWEGKLIPGLEIKAFDRDERAAAESWLEIRVS